jgi:hypothetical protein
VDLAIAPAYHFHSRGNLIANVQFEVSSYLNHQQNRRDEYLNELARSLYHPDAADHPDYFPDDTSHDVGDSSDSDASQNSSVPPSSQ